MARRLEAEDGMPVVTATFRRERASVRQTRGFVRDVLGEWKLPELVDTAELVTSELASNAVLHARCDVFRVTVRRLPGDGVRVVVTDLTKTLPTAVRAGDDEDHGRGLAIVEAMSVEWGADPLPWGKRVWADLRKPPVEEPPVHRDPLYTGGTAQAVYVLIVVALAAVLTVGVAAQQL
ncbi:ATP-binding protein [Streptomyces sp. NPDC019990]|uniref:ATP-binding protein n=1 Tax=Streptomyces sp. NPDC019990 TaxID=3154693 RepID=UPI0033C0FFC3